jgi:hypothetical protein
MVVISLSGEIKIGDDGRFRNYYILRNEEDPFASTGARFHDVGDSPTHAVGAAALPQESQVFILPSGLRRTIMRRVDQEGP